MPKRVRKTVKKGSSKRKTSVRSKTRKGKTRKGKATKATMSIPQLRTGLQYISNVSERLCRSNMPHEKKVRAFQSEWHKVFGKKMDANVANDYLHHIHPEGHKGNKRHTRRHHGKMRGGAAELQGAPVDYMTRPGVEAPYGNYLEYVKGGFDVGVPVQGMASSCGVQGGTTPYPNTGSNQAGGGVIMDALASTLGPVGTAASAVAFRPYSATNPESINMKLGTDWKGQIPGPGSESWQHAFSYRMPPGVRPVVPIANGLARYLPTDIPKPPGNYS